MNTINAKRVASGRLLTKVVLWPFIVFTWVDLQVANGEDHTALYVPTAGAGVKTEGKPRIIEINLQELSQRNEVSFYNDCYVKKVGMSGNYTKLI